MAQLTVEDCAASRAPARVMRRIDKVMTVVVQSRFEEFGLSYWQWVALKTVRDGMASTAGDLAREMGITTGATTRMIDGLEGQGLLARDRTHKDRRVVRLSLTPAGAVTVERLMDRAVGVWNEALAGFEQDEVTRLVGSLVKLLAAAERLLPAREMAIKEAGE